VKPSFPRGLYVITDRDLCVESGMTASVRAALRGGSAIVQYRDKTGDHRRRQREAAALARECRNANALFIVNDDPELARACDAGGVHLGREDTDLAQARQIIGDKRLIGVSCYDSIERARDAYGVVIVGDAARWETLSVDGVATAGLRAHLRTRPVDADAGRRPHVLSAWWPDLG
jgi:thiamine-phosphate diphosphorylase